MNIHRRQPLSRRTVLRGLGAAVALPLLDAMIPSGGLARAALADAAGGAAGAGLGASGHPLRMAAIFMPNGVHWPDWTPEGLGKDYKLSRTLEPLQAVRDDVLVLSNLALDNAKPKGDGPGDHARSAAAFLTGAHPFKTAGSNIKLGVSMDQVAAREVGHHTRLPSLELGLDKGGSAGDCDSGYACAYVNNVSWASETTPVPKEVDPGVVFDRLFGAPGDKGGEAARQKRLRYRKSILDFVAEDAKALNGSLGAGDRHKLDEFATSVREIEKRVEVARQQSADAGAPPAGHERPGGGVPQDVVAHAELMWDMLALAFQTDVTRVSTMMIGRDGSERSYHNLGISDGHHSLSHHQREERKIEQIRKIDRFHVEQFARFVEKLRGIKEGDGTLLDNCMILCGAGIGDGNRHNHDALPVLLAGRGGGTITPGRHVQFAQDTPLCNLYVSMLDRMGVKTPRFGDSTGPLGELTV
jgi:hypothetical protein